MTDLIQRLTDAIFRQEGHDSQYKNPGSLRGAPWIANPPITNGFWKPDSRAQGVAGALHVVALRVAKGESLRELITAWAPPSDHNNTAAYIMNVAGWCSIHDIDAPLYNYLEIPS